MPQINSVLFFLVVLIVGKNNLYGQDTLYLSTGNKVPVEIEERTKDGIQYKIIGKVNSYYLTIEKIDSIYFEEDQRIQIVNNKKQSQKKESRLGYSFSLGGTHLGSIEAFKKEFEALGYGYSKNFFQEGLLRIGPIYSLNLQYTLKPKLILKTGIGLSHRSGITGRQRQGNSGSIFL